MFRRTAEPWRLESIDKSNGKCFVTGKDFECVHHVYSLKYIIEQSFKETNIDKKDYFDYTNEELDMLKNKSLELHYRYGLGVCLTKAVHKEFHMQYGYGNNCVEDFNKFVREYKSVQ